MVAPGAEVRRRSDSSELCVALREDKYIRQTTGNVKYRGWDVDRYGPELWVGMR